MTAGLVYRTLESKRQLTLVNGIKNEVYTTENTLTLIGPDKRVQARHRFTFEGGHLGKYIHKMKLVQRSRFVPKNECSTPVPGWKKGEWVADTLPAKDPAHDKSREVIDR